MMTCFFCNNISYSKSFWRLLFKEIIICFKWKFSGNICVNIFGDENSFTNVVEWLLCSIFVKFILILYTTSYFRPVLSAFPVTIHSGNFIYNCSFYEKHFVSSPPLQIILEQWKQIMGLHIFRTKMFCLLLLKLLLFI